MDMEKRPLWSEGKKINELVFDKEDEMIECIYNLYEDILCLKESVTKWVLIDKDNLPDIGLYQVVFKNSAQQSLQCTARLVEIAISSSSNNLKLKRWYSVMGQGIEIEPIYYSTLHRLPK